MKKKILKTLLILIVFLMTLSFNKVSAWENGGSIGGTPAGGSGGDYNTNGTFYRVLVTGYRVTLVKYIKGSNNPQDIASKTYISDVNIDSNSNYSVYLKNSGHGVIHYTSGGSKATLVKNGGSVSWTTTENSGKNGLSKIYGTNSENLMKKTKAYTWSSDTDGSYVLNYYKALKDSSSDTIVNYIKNEFGIDIDNYEKLGCDQLIYYYILVEPMQIIEKNKNGTNFEVYFGTVSELNTLMKDGRMSTYIYTPSTSFKMNDGTDLSFDYFGSGVGNSPAATTNILGKNGYGVGVIWIGEKLKDACKKCYSRTINDSSGGMTCKNIDKNNETSFNETYEETDCDKATKEEETNTEDGKLIESNNENCNLYCIESAFASFPGGISTNSTYGRINLGGYFAWPKAYDSADFNMHMTSTLTCRIVAKNGKTCSKDDAVKVEKAALNYLNTLSFAANLTAGTNQPINNQALVTVKTDIKEPSKIDWETTNKRTESFSVSKTVYFEINEKTNRYQNVSTGEVSNTFINEYISQDRYYGNISHSLNDDINKKYDLKISDVQLGSGNQFGEKITNYVCHYNLTDTCKCPDSGEGICYPGRDLYEYTALGYTCLEAQKKFCGNSTTTTTIETKVCSYKCTTNKEVDITTCVEKEWATGKYKDMDDAVDTCTRKEQKCASYTCYNDTSVDITSCVYELAPGKNEIDNPEDIANARIECEKKKQAEGKCTGGNTCSDDVAKCQMEGKSLYECQVEYNPTCKNKSIDEIADCLKSCPSTCYYKGQPIPQYSECISKGGNSSTCYNAWCKHEACTKEPCYYCPGTNIDITKCVVDKVAASANDGNNVLETDIPTAITECAAAKPECNGGNGGTCKIGCKWVKEKHSKTTYYYKKCSDSKEICDTKIVYCPDNKCQKIVYRVIDLNNPFPGKEGEGVTSDFSNGGTGRFPNANWNYAETVKEEILNARGAKGEELYNLPPLYTIVLTPENMKKIKSSSSGYNNKNKYSDFTLDCKGSSKHDACVSSFLHSGEYVTIDTNNSVCGNITNADEFHKCYERIN